MPFSDPPEYHETIDVEPLEMLQPVSKYLLPRHPKSPGNFRIAYRRRLSDARKLNKISWNLEICVAKEREYVDVMIMCTNQWETVCVDLLMQHVQVRVGYLPEMTVCRFGCVSTCVDYVTSPT